MSVLTVGTGGEFKTISDAVSASHDGDVIKVQAGTYTNDFSTVNAKITIEGVGGMVKLVATTGPTNGKAFFVVNQDLTISNFDISGASDGTQYGNMAAFRYQSGNLTIENSYLHNNQEGLLADGNLAGSITIDHTEIANNGSDGMTHNVYINNVGTTVLSNSYIHDVLDGGTEFRSRGPNTTLVNDRIYDNSGTANYVIDVPSGGNVNITDNVLQKSGNASNPDIIHWGGSVVTPFHADSSLTVTGNTIIDDDTKAYSLAVLNQSNILNATGQITVPVISGNSFYGLNTARVTNMPATMSGNTQQTLAQAPVLDTSHPWTAPTTVWNPTADPEVVSLTTSKHTVTGGASLLTVTATAGNNTIVGGSGGVNVTSTGPSVSITTAAGAADTVTAASRSTIQSAGHDLINLTSVYNTVNVSGHAVINDTGGGNTINITGDSVVTTTMSDTIKVTGAGATVTGSGSSLTAIETNGSLVFAETGGAVASGATVSGGAATVSGSAVNGTMVTTAKTGGVSVALSGGTDNVMSYGADTIAAGSGTDVVRLVGTAGVSIHGGTGTLQVVGTTAAATVTGGASKFTFVGAGSSLDFVGGTGTAFIKGGTAAMTVNGGSGNTTLLGGSGGDAFVGGSGTALITEGSGTNSVDFGTGNTTVSGGSGRDVYHVLAGQSGSHDLIRNFQVGTDKLDLASTSIQSQAVAANTLTLTLTDGTTIGLAGISHFTSNMLA